MRISTEPVAWQLFHDEKYEDALPLLQQLDSVTIPSEERVEILDAIAYCFVQLDRLDDAIANYEAILKIQPEDIDSLMNIGRLFYDQGDISQALTHFQRAVDAGYVDQKDLRSLAKLYYRQQCIPEARKVLDVLVKHHPEDGRGFAMIGDIEQERGNYLQATFAYARAGLLETEDNPGLIRNIIALILKMQQFDQAIKSITLYLEDYPEDAEMIYNLAVAEYQTNDINGAITHLEQAIALQPEFPLATKLLDEVRQKANRT